MCKAPTKSRTKKAAGKLLGTRFVQSRDKCIGPELEKRNFISLALLLGYWILPGKPVSPVGQRFDIYPWLK